MHKAEKNDKIANLWRANRDVHSRQMSSMYVMRGLGSSGRNPQKWPIAWRPHNSRSVAIL